MKSLLKFPLLVAVATMMTCSFSACSDNDDPDLCASDCRYVAAFKSAISTDGRRRRPDGRRQE